MRWLLAGGSAVAAIGIYIGLAVPAPLSGGGETTVAAAAAVVSEPVSEPVSGSMQISSDTTDEAPAAADEAPAAPTVTAAESAPVTRSRGS